MAAQASCSPLFGDRVYVGSAIYTSSIPDLMATFGVSQVVATLGLTLFILGYGIGPSELHSSLFLALGAEADVCSLLAVFLAPIQEMPHFGRNPVYISGLFLFVLFQVPVIFAKNIGTILVFRFLAGFVGSPALATGGASLMGESWNLCSRVPRSSLLLTLSLGRADIFPMESAGKALVLWSLGAVLGPVFGPVIVCASHNTLTMPQTDPRICREASQLRPTAGGGPSTSSSGFRAPRS